MIIVGAVHVIIAVTVYFGHKHTLKQNLVGIGWTYRFVCSMSDPEDIDNFDEILNAKEPESKTMLAKLCKKVKLEHSLISVFGSHPCEALTTVDRIFLLYSSLSSGAAVGTMS